MLFYSVSAVVREGILICNVLASWKQISSPFSQSHFTSLFLDHVDQVLKYLLPSIFYSHYFFSIYFFLQDITKINWNKPLWFKMLSDVISLLTSYDTHRLLKP